MYPCSPLTEKQMSDKAPGQAAYLLFRQSAENVLGDLTGTEGQPLVFPWEDLTDERKKIWVEMENNINSRALVNFDKVLEDSNGIVFPKAESLSTDNGA